MKINVTKKKIRPIIHAEKGKLYEYRHRNSTDGIFVVMATDEKPKTLETFSGVVIVNQTPNGSSPIGTHSNMLPLDAYIPFRGSIEFNT